MPRLRFIDLARAAFVVVSLKACLPPELCVPQEGTVGFFSQGDCVLTNRDSFRGHEWLTLLANRDLPPSRQFADGEIREVIEGNRRLDWPKELLVHMAHSVAAYAAAAAAAQDRPENQPLHFLLGPDNESADAVRLGRDVVRARTKAAVTAWVSDRTGALTRIGEACHTIQDAFSSAHAIRRAEDTSNPWCIEAVKAYLTRAPGFELPGERYHGGRTGDTIGHITTLDSIYRPGRDCYAPDTTDGVEACLSEEARRARLATRDYLAVVNDLVGREGIDDDAVDAALAPFFDAHLAMCL